MSTSDITVPVFLDVGSTVGIEFRVVKELAFFRGIFTIVIFLLLKVFATDGFVLTLGKTFRNVRFGSKLTYGKLYEVGRST